ncbi:uncharacterized protein LOC124931790 [Impatiens glandulifera]|uniref:uncharacterized protein LOC124931790 n=1 Tax=Impatiens glandulifera TaxID=253017 RepID=UPI001FB068F5|nr:uncharacterized protein LOC124931790 [Impatiens glandulifera]
MHHLAPKKSNLVGPCPDAATKFVGFRGNDLLLCPKPRRLGYVVSELLKPPRCSNHGQASNGEGDGVLNMITEKILDTRESECKICSFSNYYIGSPPGRVENPLVHDTRFIHRQMEFFSPITRTKLSDKFEFASQTQESR